MDYLKNIFQQMKDAKASMDQSADEANQEMVTDQLERYKKWGIGPEVQGVTEEELKNRIQTQNGLAMQGGMMAGSISDAGAKAKALGQGVAKIFRDKSVPLPTANRAAKIADLQNTMNQGKSMANPEIIGLAGKTEKLKLENLPEFAKQAVMKRMREKGIDPSTLKE